MKNVTLPMVMAYSLVFGACERARPTVSGVLVNKLTGQPVTNVEIRMKEVPPETGYDGDGSTDSVGRFTLTVFNDPGFRERAEGKPRSAWPTVRRFQGLVGNRINRAGLRSWRSTGQHVLNSRRVGRSKVRRSSMSLSCSVAVSAVIVTIQGQTFRVAWASGSGTRPHRH